MNEITVLELLDLDLQEHKALQLRCLAGRKGLGNALKRAGISRPGLLLTGFSKGFSPDKAQVFGWGEYEYLLEQGGEDQGALKHFFSYPLPFCVFCSTPDPPASFLSQAEEARVPVLHTSLNTEEFSLRLLRSLGDILAPQKKLHAVLVEVHGVGVLIQGESGVGKSEAALELLERGHRLIADDAVLLKCFNGKIIMGYSDTDLLKHHMEIRGLGIVEASQIFGVRSVRDRKQVDMIVILEDWDNKKNYDRLGMEEQYQEVLGVPLPCFTIPVKPGRNIPIIIEAAALNERLKSLGYHAARELNRDLTRSLEHKRARGLYQDYLVAKY